MSVRVIKLDYDKPYGSIDVREYIEFAAHVLGLKIKNITITRSQNGGIHALVVVDKNITPMEHALFEYFAMSDRARIKYNLRRANWNYPYQYAFLFDFYVHKPKQIKDVQIEIGIELYAMAIAIEYLNKYEHK